MIDWKLENVTPIYRDRISGELQVCQPDLGAMQGYGADHPEHNHAAHTGQPGHQAQSRWVCERKVLLDQPDHL